MRSAAAVPVVLAMMLAAAGCEPPEPVELGPQSSGGLASSGQGGDGATPDGNGDAATDGNGGASGLPSADGAPRIQGQSLVDAGRGAAFAQNLAPEDIPYFQQAEISARVAVAGSTINWRNPGSGTAGTITVLGKRTIGGQDCRDFFLTATIGGRQHSETATACMSGSDWVIPA